MAHVISPVWLTSAVRRKSIQMHTQLQRQLGFLKRSCDAFDAGQQDEGLRIAVSLRVLFHDTQKSTSLLTHLGIRSTAKVLTTFEPGYSEDKQTGVISVAVPFWVDSTGARTPPLADGERHEFILATEWWDEIVMATSHKFSRQDIVMAAANQDGGAHVDASPDAKTRSLVQGVGTYTRISPQGPEKRELDNHHFFLLRQFAYEVLMSPDITKYARCV